ncbi:type II toxin-antitoxin system Phd/YefM family antitoxin [Spirosoma aerophilum]
MNAILERSSAQDARKNLSEIIGKAAFGNQPTVITRSGKNAAVVISYEDYERFRELEDKYDGDLATKRLASGGKRYSLDEVKTELGLNE